MEGAQDYALLRPDIRRDAAGRAQAVGLGVGYVAVARVIAPVGVAQDDRVGIGLALAEVLPSLDLLVLLLGSPLLSRST